MPKKVAINGFGRIGRAAFKILTNTPNPGSIISPRLSGVEIEIVAINDLTPPETLAYLLKYDSVYGKAIVDVEGKSSEGKDYGGLRYNNKTIPVFHEKDPENLPWAELGVDIVIESTGFFTNYEDAAKHIKAGAKKVVISAPSKSAENEFGRTLVIGTDKTTELIEGNLAPNVVSNASCTTNCISPVIQVISNEFGIENALMTTIHGYTSTQNLVDGPNKNLRRARAAAENIIPSTTGAAIATTKVIDNLNNKFDGIAFRVPVPTGSVSDITMLVSNDVSVEQINQVLINASNEDRFQGILTTTTEAIVSTDIIGDYHSAIIDLELTKVVGRLVKVVAWYDNEWGYSNRLSEMVELI